MKFHAKHIKLLMALLKEFMDHVVIQFQADKMQISGVDTERIIFIQSSCHAMEIETEMYQVGAPLLDIYKFVRGCSELEIVQLGVEDEQILTATLANDDRKTWYRFPCTFVPLDIVRLQMPDIGTTISFPTLLIRKTLKEIVHSQLFLIVQLDPLKGMTFSTWTKKGSGGGKATLSTSKLISHVYYQTFLVKYIQKFIRMASGKHIIFQFPKDMDKPLVLKSDIATSIDIYMAICPYKEG
jgi:hypothetical protein